MSAGPLPPPILLTIAGSDSGGAAGLQADLKTWAALGAYGMSAITAVTAQNSERVVAVHYLPPDFVAAQIDAVLSDYGAVAIKTGFLGRVDIIAAVAGRLAYWRQQLSPRPFILIDPVLVNHRGESMFAPAVAAAYRDLLCPLADLMTPNTAEAVLLDRAGGGENVLVTGLAGKRVAREDEIVDVYGAGDRRVELPQPRLDTINTHGSGDTLSAAICAYRAQGHDCLEAIRRAQTFTHAAIRRGAAWRLGAGHGPLGYGGALPDE
ncbi:MAG: bifunctional hydroxymethylpyrimidine kinase/phosphomethylpyrimidine kinase [Candidatus Promineofilum sp.]|nr:bifunctional hydroxymethylpyrimidine kinase/phosphomethylpyrimidine kinase [Promineifilum sp.]